MLKQPKVVEEKQSPKQIQENKGQPRFCFFWIGFFPYIGTQGTEPNWTGTEPVWNLTVETEPLHSWYRGIRKPGVYELAHSKPSYGIHGDT